MGSGSGNLGRVGGLHEANPPNREPDDRGGGKAGKERRGLNIVSDEEYWKVFSLRSAEK